MRIEAIALCRVSTLEQKIEGHSLERQEASVIKASQLLNAEIVKTWSLDQSSRSGKNLKRKDLSEMLIYCKLNRQVKYLIVDEVDRFMRSIDEFYFFEVSFRELGVKVWYASQPELNTDDWTSKVTKVLAILRAEMSNIERQGKSLNGLKARIKLGYWPFPLHQGYMKGTEAGLHIPDPTRFRLLRDAFREIVARRYTVNETLERLNNNGYKSPNDKPLRIDKFRELLKDPYYAGALRIDTWDKELWNDRGLHNAMITMEEWEELQLIVNNKMRKFQRKQHNPSFPLSNLLYCSSCLDKKLVGFTHRNGKNNWTGEEYRCRGCNTVVKKPEAHKMTDEFLESIKMLRGNTEDFKQALRKIWQEEEQDSFNRIKQLKIRLHGLLDEKNKLATGIVMRPELADDLTQSLEQKKLEIKEVEKEIAEAENIENDFIEFTEFSIGYIKNLKDNWWELEHDERVECKLLISKQEIFINFSEKVYTPELSPILRLIGTEKEAFRASDSHMVEVRGVAPLSER
jgi:DNA invertase Pin-like site-specific DNA recombinase